MDSLHKGTTGKVYGKAFGVKKLSSTGTFAHFGQSLEGQFLSNEIIKADVTTSFSGAETNSIMNVKLKGDAVELENVSLISGPCKVLINDFLERDIDRRRKAEIAARKVI